MYRIVSYRNVASTLLLVWTGLKRCTIVRKVFSFRSSSSRQPGAAVQRDDRCRAVTLNN